MTNEPHWHPDLLRRFVATPYVFDKSNSPSRLRVESNDLEIALGVRRSNIIERQGQRVGLLLCKLIRDASGPVDDAEISVVSDGPLRVLHMGSRTILIYDKERSELLGFVSRNVRVHELVSSVIPSLLSPQDQKNKVI